MVRYLFLVLLSLSTLSLFSQTTEIPEHIFFAGMKLNLSNGLRDALRVQVNTLTKNKFFFQQKVDRADAYFPIIERVLEEEGVPHDFKYLVIQESQLQSDAISSSNAVGFWQFKKESAHEVGIQISNEIDERKHITASTRGAAKYLMKNYQLLTNWVYALIAYNTGYGGVKKYIESKYVGATEMDLDENLHTYVVKFLAHKLAYEERVGYNPKPPLNVLEYNKSTKGKSLADLALELKLEESKLKDYNKWLLNHKVPEDKDYHILLPLTYEEKLVLMNGLGINDGKSAVSYPTTTVSAPIKQSNPTEMTTIPLFTTNNGLKAIIARKEDNAARLAFAGKISVERFFHYNDMEKFEETKSGQIYYFESKNNKGIVLYHTVSKNESLWEISQKYGIKLSQLMKKNRIETGEAILEGRILNLRTKRSDDEPIRFNYPSTQPIKLDTTQNQKKTEKPIIFEKKVLKDTIAPQKQVEIKKTILQKDSAAAVLVSKPINSITINSINTRKDSLKIFSITQPIFVIDSSYKYHFVNQGQTLYALSRYYGIKVDTLKDWNNIGMDGIKFGQILIVSKINTSIQKKFSNYTVKVNQNLENVASEKRSTIEKLLLWNDKKSATVVTGEILKINNGK
jgi:membrane-bound lytic murein transglycosylase D